jgi:thiamine pyrophosphate-dependent acetolactate synthase large subunit-like protein
MLEDVEKTEATAAATMDWGSDAVAQALRDLGFDYIALNPGASYRGLHDSLVNYLGNRAPQMLVCLHEEHAVALAHGYAKVTDRPMAVALHSNVGLMHGLMAIFNAFCDRKPMLILGATGPIDAEQRRPWIDWLHTTADQGALLRGYTKWDDTPGSIGAAVASLGRAFALTSQRPSAPTYVCLDAAVQEQRIAPGTVLPTAKDIRPALAAAPEARVVREIAEQLLRAKKPLILAGRSTRSEQSWTDRIALAERLGASVLTNAKLAIAFPTNHPLSAGPPTTYRSKAALARMREADVILSLDWLDLGGMLHSAAFPEDARPTIISITNDERLHNGWSKDHFEYPRTDLTVAADPEATVRCLLEVIDAPAAPRSISTPPANGSAHPKPAARKGEEILLDDIGACVAELQRSRPVSIVHTPTGWPFHAMTWVHPLDSLGASDGGEGIGSGPGMAIGAALALRGSGRMAVSILGDGDFSMSMNALWTAAHYAIPVLIIIANNGSYLNDEIHQHAVAETRRRPTENRWIGQQTMDPRTDLAAIARAQGVVGYGPVERRSDLAGVIAKAVADVDAGSPVVIDVRIAIEMDRPK